MLISYDEMLLIPHATLGLNNDHFFAVNGCLFNIISVTH